MHHVLLAFQCVYAVMKEVKMGMRRKGIKFHEEGKDWRMPGLLYVDNLVLRSAWRIGGRPEGDGGAFC